MRYLRTNIGKNRFLTKISPVLLLSGNSFTKSYVYNMDLGFYP
jgi:hypothetical protein